MGLRNSDVPNCNQIFIIRNFSQITSVLIRQLTDRDLVFPPRRTIAFSSYLCTSIFTNMLIQVVKSKIHRVRVTQAELNYVGSVTIDEALMEVSNLVEGERVQVVNINNGERLETYVIKGDKGSGTICLNGRAARKV